MAAVRQASRVPEIFSEVGCTQLLSGRKNRVSFNIDTEEIKGSLAVGGIPHTNYCGRDSMPGAAITTTKIIPGESNLDPELAAVRRNRVSRYCAPM